MHQFEAPTHAKKHIVAKKKKRILIIDPHNVWGKPVGEVIEIEVPIYGG